MAVKSLSIRIDEEMLNKLHVVADYEGRSANSQILILIRDAIEKYIINSKCFHRLDDRAHTLSEVAQGVLYSRRDFGINGAGDDAVLFHRPQAVGQHLLADTVERLSQLVEPPRSDEKITQYQQLPLASDQADGCCYGTIGQFGFCFHIAPPKVY